MSQQRLPVILALGVTQTIAWASSYYLPAILAAPIARDLGISPTYIFAAFSIAVLISGLIGPRVGRHIDRVGGRGLLAISNLVFAAGLVALALAQSLAMVGVAWLILGLGMGLGLYDSAFATLTRLYGREARSAITGIALIAGLASTVGWPLSAWGIEALGWRTTCLAWAAAHILLALPLNLALLPEPAPTLGAPAGDNGTPVIAMDRTMWLLAIAFAALWFVATAMASHLPGLLVAAGATHAQAVAAAALMGPAQVAARVVEARYLMGYHPLVSARLAAMAHPIAVLLLACGGAAFAPAFALVHGAGNGIMTIARGTVPLAIYGPANYGYRLGLLGAPARVAQALAPFLFAVLIEQFGAGAFVVSGLLGVVTLAAFLLIHAVVETPTAPVAAQQ